MLTLIQDSSFILILWDLIYNAILQETYLLLLYWGIEWVCLEIQLKAFFHFRNDFFICYVLFQLLSIVFNSGSLLKLLIRYKYCF